MRTVPRIMLEQRNVRSSSNRSSFSEFDARRKQANTYAKARTKTFRMVKILKSMRVKKGMRQCIHFSRKCLPSNFMSVLHSIERIP